MSEKSDKLNTALRKWHKKLSPIQQFDATVVSVDDTDYTCVIAPIDGGANYTARLKPIIDGDDHGVIAIPENDSYVLAGILNNNDNSAYIIKYSKVKTYLIKNNAGATVLLKDDGTIEINGNGFGGLVKVNDLVTRLNNIEAAFNAHTHILTLTSGTGTAAVPANAVTETVAGDVENTKVKQGG